MLARAKGGYYSDIPLEELVSTLIKHIVSTTGIDKNLIDEICFGKGEFFFYKTKYLLKKHLLQKFKLVRGPSGQGNRDLRIATLISDLPIRTSCLTGNS